MEDVLYPERARHRSAHELFMADFLQLRQALGEEGRPPSSRTGSRGGSRSWLRFHISVNDVPARRRSSRGAARRRPASARAPIRGHRPS